MRIHVLIPIIAVTVVLIGGTILWAQGMAQHHQGGQHPANCPMGGAQASQAAQCPIMADLTASLKLTDAQTKQVKEIQTKAHETMIPYHQTMMAKQRAIADALKSERPDAATIKRLVAEQGAAMIACRQVMIDAQLALKGVLTVVQYAKLPACPMLTGTMDCGMQGHGAHMGQTQGSNTEQQVDHSRHHE
ncbi:MAG: Spy/CpxP family protein refolding chaperone [Armatimonadota bacterium]